MNMNDELTNTNIDTPTCGNGRLIWITIGSLNGMSPIFDPHVTKIKLYTLKMESKDAHS